MFRNREFRLVSIVFLALFIVGSIIGFRIGLITGILVVTISAVFCVVFFLFTRKRYQNLALLSEQINHVLHDEDRYEFDDFNEGELSILHSEIKKMTIRIREQNDNLKKDKQYLSDSLADIAHQLRTPLTSATLSLSLAAKSNDEKQQQDFIREAEGLLLQTDWLITTLLKISRLDAGVVEMKNESVNISNLISNALQPLLIPMELQNTRVLKDIPESAVINGDSNWLSEAMLNILKNCMHSAVDNGEISIICNDTALFTEIVIRDNGTGFADDDLPHIFKRFYRGESQNISGFGIGLALAHMIITCQNGIITAGNHKDSGAVFTIRFNK